MDQQPKFKLDDKVFAVRSQYKSNDRTCPVCNPNGAKRGPLYEKGGVGYVELAGEWFACPKCYGRGEMSEHSYYEFSVDPNPLFISGYRHEVKRRGKKGIEKYTRYYCWSELDELHSVYEDSNGDEQFEEHILFSTLEEAEAYCKVKNAEQRV